MKDLKDSVCDCPDCGRHTHRDLNASKNILRKDIDESKSEKKTSLEESHVCNQEPLSLYQGEYVKKQTYTIELTKEQLHLVTQVLDEAARLRVGQLRHSVAPHLMSAIIRHYKDTDSDTIDTIIERSTELLDELHTLCWAQPLNASYGVGYSEIADTLFDMNEVLRHKLWLDSDNASNYTVDATPPLHWNKKIPLIKVEIKK